MNAVIGSERDRRIRSGFPQDGAFAERFQPCRYYPDVQGFGEGFHTAFSESRVISVIGVQAAYKFPRGSGYATVACGRQAGMWESEYADAWSSHVLEDSYGESILGAIIYHNNLAIPVSLGPG
jgi:hypothetical protein